MSIKKNCAVLGVRREGYYEWLKRPSQADRDAPLVSTLRNIRKKHPDYGTVSMIEELPEEIKCSYRKGYRVCREYGLLTKRRRPHSLTKADPKAQKSEDLVNREFGSDRPGAKWFTDITEITCKDGKSYLCGILDGFNSALLGFSMSDHMREELCTSALISAANRYAHELDCILHSDRGSQFTSNLFREVLAHQGFCQSMGRTGVCFDNAKMESFWATLKNELIYKLPTSQMTRDQLRLEVFWIEGYYNRNRRHTANMDKLPPLVKRESFIKSQLNLTA